MDRAIRRPTLPCLLAAASLAACCGAVLAQAPSAGPGDRPEHVDVHAPVRLDVATLCPGVGQALPDELAGTARERAVGAVVHVRFLLDGDHVEHVVLRGGPLQYQHAVRRAVRWLDCRGQPDTPQGVRLQVRFVDPFARSAGTVARREGPGGPGGARTLVTLANDEGAGR